MINPSPKRNSQKTIFNKRLDNLRVKLSIEYCAVEFLSTPPPNTLTANNAIATQKLNEIIP
jgi:hypothetical protein